MIELKTNDEAFLLSLEKITEVINIIHSRKTPESNTFEQWDEYTISFYMKMCRCFRVHHLHLEPTSDDDHDMKKQRFTSTQETSSSQEQHLEPTSEDDDAQKKQTYSEELVKDRYHANMSKRIKEWGPEKKRIFETAGLPIPTLEEMRQDKTGLYYEFDYYQFHTGPYNFGSYSSGPPQHIPYHLYLLVKEAVDIMKRSERQTNTTDLSELETVEKKIRFFCTYFHAHLPTNWNYNREDASLLITGLDLMDGADMTGYSPAVDHEVRGLFDVENHLSQGQIMNIMIMIHSRETPNFWKMRRSEIAFYYKICSVFSIDYHNLKTASDNAVCLMNMASAFE